MNPVLKLWNKYGQSGFGRWLFSFMVCRKAPYFATIRPRFEVLEVGRAQVSMKKRRSVENHIGTVHAIAMCNLAEIAGGTLTEVSIPASMRWLPKGMTVSYLKVAKTDVTAFATLPTVEEGVARDVPAHVDIKDRDGTIVCQADITMYVSPRKKG
ncbi:MAG: hotdog fold domain-containing protein [Burkholderiales bacterium]|nr:hotdog fold domain-containing protein [Burkholderiales bacterium]